MTHEPPMRGDMQRQVAEYLGEAELLHLTDAVVDILADRHGRFDLDDLDETELIDVVTLAEERVEAERAERAAAEQTTLREGLTRAARARVLGEPAVWTSAEGVTVSAMGLPRFEARWPQPVAHVTISAAGQEPIRVSGWDIGSWEHLESLVAEVTEDVTDDRTAALTQARMAQYALARAEQALTRARAERDNAVVRARHLGVTAYRIAKTLGVAESTVGRIPSRR